MPHASHSSPFSDLLITSQECEDDGFRLRKEYEMGFPRFGPFVSVHMALQSMPDRDC